jgi:hypothetical protein
MFIVPPEPTPPEDDVVDVVFISAPPVPPLAEQYAPNDEVPPLPPNAGPVEAAPPFPMVTATGDMAVGDEIISIAEPPPPPPAPAFP